MGIERPGEYDFEWVQENFSKQIAIWKTQHRQNDDPEYWKSLLLQLSVLFLTPLNYTDDDFKKITDSVLIIIGDRDGAVPLNDSIEMYQMIENAELAVLPNADHLRVIAEPDAFIHTVLDFLTRHSKSK